MTKISVSAFLFTVAALGLPAAAQVQPKAPSTEEMIKALATPVPSGREAGLSRGFRRVTRAPVYDLSPNGGAGAGGSEEPAPAVTSSAASRREIGVPLLFDVNSARIRPESASTLAEIAKALQSQALKDARILLEGHTDATGDAAQNLTLSTERANAVKDYLVQTAGIDASRLSTIGKGQSEPLDPADPTAAKNRRVVLVNVTQD